ncbi:NepR family anti-sigma factor [Methylobacterium nodulans]|uniref:Anti-sigma factor NepR domain-containing protein n=1 Tax=Methylobacterium nodulans (strain LMG 21967 / CNCM I-2342 / ORS 2060) TaxID=460265 RepID=B8IPA4_METNO|nr:NepR family anti-sigma factor [Methylobacterium nodulans]ACL60422.1 hypothetical protein Mnod_5580 [Methylobacterium nodulans ORS 2060]
MINAVSRDELGRALRRVYADQLTAPAPERFTALLAALERGSTGAEAAPGRDGGPEPARDGTEEASR